MPKNFKAMHYQTFYAVAFTILGGLAITWALTTLAFYHGKKLKK